MTPPRVYISCVLYLVVALGLAGCAGSGSSGSKSSSNTTPGPVAKIVLSPASASLAVGATQQLTATVSDANGNAITGATLTWVSSSASIATVSGSGLVTAVAAGTANVTAASGAITSAAAAVTVTPPPVASVTVSPASPSIQEGATQQFTAAASDAKGTAISGATFTWASSNTAVATINTSGLATSLSAGTTNITATAGGVSSSADVLTVKPVTTVTGTAAMGAPLAGVTVTLEAASGTTSRTAVTAADGTFTLDSTGMTPPFLLSVTPNSGAPLYSVSADSNPTATINLTPLTDLAIRSWFAAQGVSIDSAFAAPSTAPPPSPTQLQPVLVFVQNQMQLWLTQQSLAASFNLISTPFAADGTGLDKVLDLTTVTNTSNGTTIKVTDGTTTRNTALTYTPGSDSVTATTTTTSGTSSSTSTSTTALPVSTPQATALAAILAQTTALSQVFAAKGAQVAATDLEPFMSSNLMFEGLNQSQFAAELVTFARGNTASITATNMNSLDTVNGKASTHMVFYLGQSQLSADMNWILTSGTWLLDGDERPAGVDLNSEYNVAQQGTILSPQSGVFADVKAPPGLVTAAAISGSVFGSSTTLAQTSQQVETFAPTPGGTLAVTLDHFDAGATLTSLIPAGTPFTFNLTTTHGPLSYTLYSNANTTEGIQLTNVSTASLSSLSLGAGNTFTWTLPKTFPIASIQLKADSYNGDPQAASTTDCRNTLQMSNISATSGSITIPGTCNGTVVHVQIGVNITGLNGESTQVFAQFH